MGSKSTLRRLRRAFLAAFLAGCSVYLWSLAFPLELPQPDSSGRFVTSFMNYRAQESHDSAQPAAAKWVQLSEVSPILVCAVVKAEDREFFRHPGLEWKSVLKALRLRLDGGRLLGASTISQQLARNLFLTPERSLQRKLTELWFTFRIEQRLEKIDIMQLYLNSIEWGVGIWGIEQASKFYFQVEPGELGLEAALFLASRIASPLTVPEGEELLRMEGVYRRVNLQLQRSGLISAARRESADGAWAQYREALLQGKSTKEALVVFAPRGPEDFHSDIERGDIERGSGCGLAKELATE